MAIANALGYPTLVDKAKDEQSDMARTLIDLQVERNPMLGHMPVVTADDGETLTCDYVVEYPTPVWQRLNRGVKPDLDATDTVTFRSGRIESYMEIDARIAERGDRFAGMARRMRSHTRAIANQLSSTVFYGDETTASFTGNNSVAGFTGLQHYVNDKGTGVVNDSHIIDASSGDMALDGTATAKNESANTYNSIYLVGWGPDTVTGFVPEGVQSGLRIYDPGKGSWFYSQTAKANQKETDQTARMRVYARHFCQELGLAVPDWRYLVRVANIPRNLLKYDGKTGPNLIRCLNVAADVRFGPDARWIAYAPRQLLPYLDTQQVETARNSTLTMSDSMGDGIFRKSIQGEIPIFISDALNTDESFVD